MNVEFVIKKLLGLAINAGVGSVVGNFFKSQVKDENKFTKVAATIASYAVGAYVADKTTEHLEKEYEELTKVIKARIKAKELAEKTVEELANAEED